MIAPKVEAAPGSFWEAVSVAYHFVDAYWIEAMVVTCCVLYFTLNKDANLTHITDTIRTRKSRRERSSSSYRDNVSSVNAETPDQEFVSSVPGPLRTSEDNFYQPYARTNDLSPKSNSLTMKNIEANPQQAFEAVMELSRNKHNGRVIEVYRLMQLVGVDQNIGMYCANSKWTIYQFYIAVCQAFIRTNMPGAIDDVVHHMRHVTNTPRNYEFYESVMRILAAQRRYKEAVEIFDFMKADGMEPEAMMLTCLVTFSFDLGLYDKCRAFFEILRTKAKAAHQAGEEFVKDKMLRVVMTQFRIFSKNQETQDALDLLYDLPNMGVEVDKLPVNVTLGVLINKSMLAKALKVLDDFKQYSDCVSYNTIMKGYARMKKAGQAVGMLSRMENLKEPIPPNLISYNTVADALMRTGQADSALGIIHRGIRKRGIVPDMFSCSILVKGISLTTNPWKYMKACCDILHELPSPDDVDAISNQVRLFQSVYAGCMRHKDCFGLTEQLCMDLTKNIPTATMRGGKISYTEPPPSVKPSDLHWSNFTVASHSSRDVSEESCAMDAALVKSTPDTTAGSTLGMSGPDPSV